MWLTVYPDGRYQLRGFSGESLVSAVERELGGLFRNEDGVPIPLRC